MVEIISSKDIENFKDLSSILADLYRIPPQEIRLIIEISGTRGVTDAYRLEMLTGKYWSILYQSGEISGILDAMRKLIEFERKKVKLTK